MSDKTCLKAKMVELEQAILAYSEDAYTQYLRSSARDAGDSVDHGQSSQEFDAAELAQGFEGPIHSHEHALEILHRIDFKETSEIHEGATVLLNGRWFVVAVATAPFVCGDHTYMGISPAAPIFECLEGKRAGDSFTFNGQTMKIEAVA